MLLFNYLSTLWSSSSHSVQRAKHSLDVKYQLLALTCITIIFPSAPLGEVKTDYRALENWRSRLNARVKLEEFRSHSSLTLGA
jgi:hypothetical protein